MGDYKPDFTAWFVLQGTIAAMHRPDFYDAINQELLEFYQPMAQAASKTRFVSRVIYNMPYNMQYAIGELVTSPGRLRHFYLRKKEIEKQARRLLGQGVEQVVVLGAGLDVLSLRLAKEYPQVTFIEIDTEASQLFKQSAWAVHQVDVPGNIKLLSGDLRDPLEGILNTLGGYNPSAKTLWLAEGFLMFLPQQNVENLFRQIKPLCGKGSYVLFTTLPTQDQGGTLAKVMQGFYLKKEKASFKWVLPYEKVGEFIKKMGYAVDFQLRCDLLHQSYIGNKFELNHDFAEDIHIATAPNM